MAMRSQLAAWMDAVIKELRVEFAKDTEPTIVAMSSILYIRYNMCRFHFFLANKSSTLTNKPITESTTTDFITESSTVTTNSLTVTTKLSTMVEIDIVIQ
jgi:hypothetical protein